MNFISERVGYEATDEGLTVRIKASKASDLKKLNLMKAWVIAWGISGGLIGSALFLNYPADLKLYLLIFLAFWAYFLFKITRAYYFRKYGIETIFLNGDQLMLRKDIHGKPGKQVFFRLKEKNAFRHLDKNDKGSWFYDSFWIDSGGNCGFGKPGSEYRFGIQLEKTEAQQLVKLLNKQIQITP
ncbi:MAG: hypothetical protein FJZ75_04945 [Bacteroidetes bacterium]|nr:hypothetical protein [Bacteroidota bacterium]